MVLPRQDVERFLYLFLLLGSFSSLPGEFLLMIEHPQLGVNLLLHDLFFHFLSLIHELFFAFELRAGRHEVRLLAPQIIGLHFKFPIHGPLNMLLFLSFAL